MLLLSLLAGLAVVIVGLLVVGVIVEAALERRDRRRYPPPGQFVDVGGHRIHVVVWGAEQPGPTVILDAGMVSFSANWAWVLPELAGSVRVVAYDRSGLGWSELGSGPHDGGTNARELTRALDILGIRGPFVLAGHSYGGLTMRAFAALRPGAVAGMVLVDASHPDQWRRFGFSSRVLGRGNRVGAILARFGLFRLWSGEYRLLADGLPPAERGQLMAFGRLPRALLASSRAAMAWDDATRPLVQEAGGLGDRPLVVLSVTEQPRMSAQLTELQAELPALSTDSRHVTIEGAYHEGLLAREEHARIVTSSILDVVEAVRGGRRLTRPTVVAVGPGKPERRAAGSRARRPRGVVKVAVEPDAAGSPDGLGAGAPEAAEQPGAPAAEQPEAPAAEQPEAETAARQEPDAVEHPASDAAGGGASR